jgi:V/A-type H+-transporting ATPase subunit D
MEKVLLAGRSLDRRPLLEAVRKAGVVHVESLEGISFRVRPHGVFSTPTWVEAAVDLVKRLLEAREGLRLWIAQELALDLELRKVTQRVNLFEKVKIPAARESIRVIRIALA